MMLLRTVIIVSLVGLTALLFAPWSSKINYSRDAINQALYHDRLREIYADIANEGERPQLLENLQHTLLQDIPDSAGVPQRPLSRWVLLPGIVLLAAVSLSVFWHTASINRVQEWQQVVALTPDLLKRALDPQAEPLTVEEVARLGLGLRSQLETQPENVQNWWLLGRIASLLNNYDMAVQAYANAYRCDPHNSELALDYADILSRSTNRRDSERGGEMLSELLQAGSTNVRALSLLAFNTYEGQRYQEAIDAWKGMLRVLPQNDTPRGVIERSIQQAEAALAATPQHP